MLNASWRDAPRSARRRDSRLRVLLGRRASSAARLVRVLLAAATSSAAAASCGSDGPTAPALKASADLHIVRRAPTAPALLTTTASFYAKKGADRELRLYYAPDAGSSDSTGAEFLRLRVRAGSLDRRPDGSAIAVGDSVLITVTADPTLMAVDFQPSGLRFAASEPAELKLRFAECDGDYDGDGDVDAIDASLRSQIAIWKHETSAGPWTELSTTLLSSLDATTTLAGFTGYAVAY